MTTQHARPRSIGGFLALELGPRFPPPLPATIAVQSARAAWRLVLRHVRPRRAWLPWYLCDSMLEPTLAEGVDIVRYGLTEEFGVPASVDPAPDEILLCVNYFGLCDAAIEATLARCDPRRVVVDHAQAYFAPPRAALATLYSPRKSVGVPDGGFLATSLGIAAPAREDAGSADRLGPLLARLADEPEAAYPAFVANEQGLAGQEPLAMSRLTRRLLESIDHDAIAARRQRNYDRLHGDLGAINGRAFIRAPAAVPLAYPWFGGGAGLRQALIDQRIYTPRYWPHLGAERDLPAFERHLYDECIPLPCTQACTARDLERIVAAVRGWRPS